ncbi:hypothetical protein [Streptomyces sp. NPDC006012]|uniref:hypothetical protein n=1 Tax=Streptomyces sp. NPDC006012 TaxID=3364739 RepID=UPI0036C36C9D
MPSLNDDQQRIPQQPEYQNAEDRTAALERYALELQAAARVSPAEIEWSLAGDIAALDVYQLYRQTNPHWPTMPPRGTKVALHRTAVGKEGEAPLIVTLNTPQREEEAGMPAPRFLAHPRLELGNYPVWMAVRTAGVDQTSYLEARSLRRLDLVSRYDDLVSARQARFFGLRAQPAPADNPYAAPAAKYLPTASGPAGDAYATPSPQPTSGAAAQRHFLNNSAAAPAHRAPGR